MKDALAIAGYALLIPLLYLAVRAGARRRGLGPELRRKLVHVGLGLATLTFPWVFGPEGVWAVVVLCGIAMLLLLGIRLRENGLRGRVQAGGKDKAEHDGILHGIDRHSLGEMWFPVSVAVVFAMAQGEWIFFLVPILILTLADATGALVGTRYGSEATVFSSLSGWKSVEGCSMFFFAAFLSAHVPLLLFTGTGRAESLLIATVLALMVTMTEAISTRGLDNLLVPLSAALLLREYVDLETTPLLWRLALITGLLAFVILSRQFTSLEGGALLAAVLFGYGCWALGDGRFLVPPVILFTQHLLVTRRFKRIPRPRHDLWPILSIAISLLPWAVAAAILPEKKSLFLACFVAGTTIHLAITNCATRIYVVRSAPDVRMRFRSLGKALFLIALPCSLLVALSPWAAVLAAAIMVASAACLEIFLRFLGSPSEIPVEAPRWIVQAAAALLGAGMLALTARFLFPLNAF